MTPRLGLLHRASLGMAAGTAMSRATGLLRTVALAWALGVTTLGDAYNTANTAPNMLLALTAGGVLSASLVPMLAREEDALRRRHTASVVLGTVLVVGLVASALLALVAPALMRLLVSGAEGREDHLALVTLGTTWMRIFSLQVALYAVSVAATGIMSARGHLALGAAAPIATNLITVAAAGAFVVLVGEQAPSAMSVEAVPVEVLGWGTTAAVAAMAVIQLWGARRSEPGLRFSPRWRDPVVGELRRLGGWMLVYVAANQIGLAVVMILASRVSGGISAYQWAFVLMQLPYAIIAVSVFSAAFPALARAAAAGDDVHEQVRLPADTALRLLLPASVGLALIAAPLAVIVVGADGAPLVAAALVGFAVSLVPFSLFQLLTRTSYAFADTRTPALVNVAVNGVMLIVDLGILSVVDSPRAQVMALALGHAASYVTGCFLLGMSLARRGSLRWSTVLGGRLRPVMVATLLMALAVVAVGSALPMDTLSRSGALGVVAVLTLVGGVLYAVVLPTAQLIVGDRSLHPL